MQSNFVLGSAVSFALHADKSCFLAMDLVNMFCMCSGPRLKTYSNKYAKYTEPKLFVDYGALFLSCEAVTLLLLGDNKHFILFQFKNAAQRDDLTAVSLSFIFFLQHSDRAKQA